MKPQGGGAEISTEVRIFAINAVDAFSTELFSCSNGGIFFFHFPFFCQSGHLRTVFGDATIISNTLLLSNLALQSRNLPGGDFKRP